MKPETALWLVQVTKLAQVGVTDAIFFFVVWSLGRSHVLEGQAVVALLSSYAGARFGMQLGRAQERRAHGGPSDPPPAGSGEIPSVRLPPATRIDRIDPRVDRPWDRSRRSAVPFAFVTWIGGSNA